MQVDVGSLHRHLQLGHAVHVGVVIMTVGREGGGGKGQQGEEWNGFHGGIAFAKTPLPRASAAKAGGYQVRVLPLSLNRAAPVSSGLPTLMPGSRSPSFTP